MGISHEDREGNRILLDLSLNRLATLGKSLTSLALFSWSVPRKLHVLKQIFIEHPVGSRHVDDTEKRWLQTQWPVSGRRIEGEGGRRRVSPSVKA